MTHCCYSLMNLSVNKFLKSVNIWRSYGQYYSGLFFDSQCSYNVLAVDTLRDLVTLTFDLLTLVSGHT